MIHRHLTLRLPSILTITAFTACALGGAQGCADGDKGGYNDALAAAGRSGVISSVPPGSAADVAGFNALPQSSNHGSGAFMDSRSIFPAGGAAGASGSVGGAPGVGGLGNNTAGAGGGLQPSGGTAGTSGATGGTAGTSGATGGAAGAATGGQAGTTG